MAAPIKLPDFELIIASGEIDLHELHPAQAIEFVTDFMKPWSEHGHSEVTIIHGKGTGALREYVHDALRDHPYVKDFRLVDGNDGATTAVLRGRDEVDLRDDRE